MSLKIALFRSEIEAYGGTARLITEYVKRSKHKFEIYALKVRMGMLCEIRPTSKIYQMDTREDTRCLLPKIPRNFNPLLLKKLPIENSDVFLVLVGPVLSETIILRNCSIPVVAYFQGAFRFLDVVAYKVKPRLAEFVGTSYGRLMSFPLSRCKALATHSKFTRKLIKRYLPEIARTRQIHIISPGIDTNIFTPSNNFGDYFLVVSRFDPLKRIELAVEAFKIFSKRLDFPSRLILAGSLTTKSNWYLLWLRRLANGARITFLINPTEEELLKLYKNAYALLFTSNREPFGIVPLEAMACGKPVIAAINDGGVLDYLKDGVNGFIVPPDARTLAEKMIILANNDNILERMGVEARRTALRYDWQIFCQRMDHLLELSLESEKVK